MAITITIVGKRENNLRTMDHLDQWIIEFKRSLDATYPLSFDLSSSLKVIWTSSMSCSSSFYRSATIALATLVSDSLTDSFTAV